MAIPKITEYQIDDIIYTKGFSKIVGPHTCKGGCCKSGALIDINEKEKILDYKDLIISLMDETQNPDTATWFEKETCDDVDFPSGKCIGTEVYNSKCAFLNKKNLCVLQIASEKIGKNRWFLKPFYCILFPLVITDKVFTYDDYQMGNEECCSIIEEFEVPLFQACKEEIIYLFGTSSYDYLHDIYEKKKLIAFST